MAKRKTYLTCTKCGKVDAPDTTVIPHNVGTATAMCCPDCAGDKDNGYGHKLASMCRACCPTGHRTRFELE
jgi:hypothetical protein